MAVTVQWDNDSKTILRYDFAGQWTWDEFITAYGQSKILLSSVPHTVHFIANSVDDESRGYLPPGVLNQTIRVYRMASPNAGRTVVVSGSPLFRSVLKFGSRLYPKITARYSFAASLEEARAMLRDLPARNA